ncbi:MAG: MoxR family ATPase [Bacteroidota bacterium]
MSFHLYTQSEKRDLPPVQMNPKINDPNLYIPSESLVHAVNVSLALGQPLLLTGEPGTGKTRLAYHVAHIFNLGKPLIFNAQTTSTMKDLFYRYDALGHFQYSQTSKVALDNEEVEARFVRYQGLGQAIKEDRRTVVLIDEIDKAPRDLPNDVLAALEDLEFTVSEVGKTYKATPENRPIIIMTSNSEKNLPDAFLRRVTYFHIPFPDKATLLKILQSKSSKSAEVDLEAIIKHFEMIRKGRKAKLKKNPATAELIYWAQLLQRLDFDTKKLKSLDQLSKDDKEKLMISYSVLAKNKEDLEALKKLVR